MNKDNIPELKVKYDDTKKTLIMDENIKVKVGEVYLLNVENQEKSDNVVDLSEYKQSKTKKITGYELVD